MHKNKEKGVKLDLKLDNMLDLINLMAFKALLTIGLQGGNKGPNTSKNT